jgi:hypothetical protein
MTDSLEELAWNCLDAPGLELAPTQSAALISAGANSVFPLLRSGLRWIAQYGEERARDFIEVNKDSSAGAVFAALLLHSTTDIIILGRINNIVRAVGQPAADALCRALWERDERMQLLAALLLSEEEHPSQRTLKGVEDTLKTLGIRPKEGSGVLLFRLLLSVLASGGDTRYIHIEQGILKLEGTNKDAYRIHLHGATLNYLFRSVLPKPSILSRLRKGLPK